MECHFGYSKRRNRSVNQTLKVGPLSTKDQELQLSRFGINLKCVHIFYLMMNEEVSYALWDCFS